MKKLDKAENSSITILDEAMTGTASEVMKLIFDTKLVTIREVIKRRVQEEVANYNQKVNGTFYGLVKPTNAETFAAGYRIKPKQLVDPNKQIEIAITAFQRNGFFILVDNKQFEHLDDEILVADTTNISFVKLTPLVGG
jgi:hypothetical protein